MSTRLDAVVRLLSEPEVTDKSPTPAELAAHLELGPGEGVQVFELEPLDPETGLGQYAVVPADVVETWNEPHELPREDGDERWTASQGVLTETLASVSHLLGAASLRELEGVIGGATQWARHNYNAEKGPFVDFAQAVARTALRRFRGRIGVRRLFLEKDDQDRREAAARSEAALADYLEHVRESMTNWLAWKRRKPTHVIADDAHCQDQIFAVVAGVLGVMRSRRGLEAWRSYERVGVPALAGVRDAVLRDLRRRRRLWLVESPGDALHAYIPRPDEAMVRREIEVRHALPIADRLRPRLSRRLQRFFDALVIQLQLDAENGEGRWGLQERIADRVGRSKSRVSEAMAKIRDEARALGIDELLVLDDIGVRELPASPTRLPPSE